MSQMTLPGLQGALPDESGEPGERWNKLRYCRACGGRLGPDKNSVTDLDRTAYRRRVCETCGRITYTKQPPERFCGLEPLEDFF